MWDQDEETAIQPPDGGPKIAWGGPPVRTPQVRGALHLDLAPPPGANLEAEIERMVALGATQISSAEDHWSLIVDPDGNEHRLLRA